MSKILCYLIMCLTWFVGYVAYSLILESCLDAINFIMGRNFYNLKRYPFIHIGMIFILFNPFCIICFECFKFLREKFINALIFSAVNAVIFLGVCAVWLNGVSHKVYLLSLTFLLSVIVFIKLYCIHKHKILTFATISMCEFLSIFVVGNIFYG